MDKSVRQKALFVCKYLLNKTLYDAPVLLLTFAKVAKICHMTIQAVYLFSSSFIYC